jgi:hypothetical protein
VKPLDPPDLKRCQAERPTGHSFMTLGPRQKHVRCHEVPVAIATEKEPAADGQRGSMSLCGHCFEVFQKQAGVPAATFKCIDPTLQAQLEKHGCAP